MTKFFEPINVSAIHIYHSALELSPLSSIIRKLYHKHRHTLLPRVIVGTWDSWDQRIAVSAKKGHYHLYSWSPCGQFVAAQTQEVVEIWDPLTFELLSTLTTPDTHLIGGPTYSPDGRSLASISDTSLVIWDLQTGGVAKEVECGDTNNVSLIWSLDGETICTISQDQRAARTWSVYTYNVASDVTVSPGSLRSTAKPHLWAHDTSFQAMTTGWDGQGPTINIFGVGSVLTNIKSFQIYLGARNGWVGFSPKEKDYQIKSFSPATYHISISTFRGAGKLLILDIQNSKRLLEQDGHYDSHCFSPDGSHFAASSQSGLHIWKHTPTPSCYTPWREFPVQDQTSFDGPTLQFSPAFSSILGCSQGTLQAWRLNGPPIVPHSNSCLPLAAPSHCGTYMVTGNQNNNTITITNLLSQAPSCFIDTNMEIYMLALTGNILLVLDFEKIVAWRLTDGGTVDGVYGDGRADHGNSIWTVPLSGPPEFSVEDRTVAIKAGGNIVHIYHAGTGEVLEPTRAPTNTLHHWYHPGGVLCGKHYLHYHELEWDNTPSGEGWKVSQTTFQEGWVKDPEGKHRLWVPVEWSTSWISGGWLHNITTLWLNLHGGIVIITL